MKFSIKDFFSKCDQIRRKLRIWSHLLKKFLMENFISLAVYNLRNNVALETITAEQEDKNWTSHCSFYPF